MKQLLINADDLGFDADTFAVSRGLMELGGLRSATILVGYPASAMAMAFARNHARDFSFGLHFNIAEGRPSARVPVPSLTGDDGCFRSPITQRLRALAGMLDAGQIADEARAQLGILADHGVRPSHLDSHGHFHKFPAVFQALQPVLKEFGIRRVRLPQTQYDNPTIYNRLLDRHCMAAFRKGVITADNFFNTRRHDPEWFERFLDTLNDGTTELGVHPGGVEDWRACEAEQIANAAREGVLSRRQIRLISYHDLPD